MVVVFVSSRVPERARTYDVILRAGGTNFAQTGLKQGSCIKVDKLATLEKGVILGELGRASREVMAQVEYKLAKLFGL